MASKKVSDLPVVATPSVDDLLMVVQGGDSKQIPIDRVQRSAGFLWNGGYDPVGTNLAMLVASGFVETNGWSAVKAFGNIASTLAPDARIDLAARSSSPALFYFIWNGSFSVGAHLLFLVAGDPTPTNQVAAAGKDVLAGEETIISGFGWCNPATPFDYGLFVLTDTDGTLTTNMIQLLAVSL